MLDYDEMNITCQTITFILKIGTVSFLSYEIEEFDLFLPLSQVHAHL